jgi:Domain of unknown function (DUF5134)
MAGPSWLAGTFAAVMIVTAAYSASRLAVSRLRRQATEFDADALHVVMGAAMAGMLVPRFSVLPGSMWVALFGIGAAWFGWHALRAVGLGNSGGSPCRFPVPHLIECVAMLYMLLAVHGPRAVRGGTSMPMAGMSASAGPVGFPALAAVLALFMLGYIVWTTDRLTALARAKSTVADRGADRDRLLPAAALAATPTYTAGGTLDTRAAAGSPASDSAGRPVLAPKLAACGKLVMCITMSYMLILML